MKTGQKDRVLKYMREHGGITRAEAFTQLGIANLTARISELRKEHIIEGVEMKGKNMYGENTSWKMYVLKENG